MADNEIVYEIKADSKKAESAIKDIDAAAKASAGGTGGIGALTAAIGGLGPAAIIAGTAIATYLVASAIKPGIQAAIEQENAINRMNQALNNAGRLSAEASQDMIKFSEDIQKNTTIADDAALGYLALASNFAKTNEQAKQLTMAAIDLAAATGVSAETALRQLGGTLNGTAGRLGITVRGVKDLTEAQLKSGEAIDLVSERYRNSAANAAKTFGGSLVQLKNEFGEVLEQVGFFFTKSKTLQFIITSVTNAVSSLAKKLGVLREGAGDVFAPIIKGMLTFLQYGVIATVPFLDVLNNIFTKLRETLGSAGAALIAFFSGDYGKAIDIAKEGLGNLTNVSDLWQLHGTHAAIDWLEGVKETITANSGIVAEAIPEIRPKIDTKAFEKDTKSIINFGEMLASGISSSMQKIGTALGQGSLSFGSFAQIALGFIGDFAIQLGTFIISSSLAIMALKAEILTFGTGWAIAAGAALIVFGAALKSFAGGPAAKVDGAAAASQGSSSLSQAVGDDTTSLADTPERQRVSTINVNIEGNVLGDKRTLGLEIADALNEAFGNDGILIARGAIS